MIKLEQIKAFSGFGSGGKPGEYYHSQGMAASQFGMIPGWVQTTAIDDETLPDLGLIQWFSQGVISGDTCVLGFARNNKLFNSFDGTAPWELAHISSVAGAGNGMIVDQKNRLLYAQERYLGMSSDLSTFFDDWKDFGASITPVDALRPMDTYEDWVVIGNQNNVALLNVTDDSFNTNALNLPDGFLIRCIKSGRTGILIGANFNNRGVLILWNAYSDRSIAPWIWLNASVKSIVPYDAGWIVLTSRNIYITNGYSIQPLIPELPDFPVTTSSLTETLLPQGAEVIEKKLVFWGGARPNRLKNGLFILNLDTGLFEFAPASNQVLFNLTMGAVFFDSNNRIHTSYSSQTPAKTYIAKLTNGYAANSGQASFISEKLGAGDNEKVAEGVKFTFGLDTRESERYPLTFDATVKIYNFKRTLWNYAQTNNASTTPEVLRVNGDVKTYTAVVGDEVTILEGVNAGLVRHITSIANPGLSNEQWTLDSVLPSNTESSVLVSVTPFKKVRTYTLSSLSELKELYFDIQNKIKGKKFLVKLHLENLGSLTPEVQSGQFIYDELSVKR